MSKEFSFYFVNLIIIFRDCVLMKKFNLVIKYELLLTEACIVIVKTLNPKIMST